MKNDNIRAVIVAALYDFAGRLTTLSKSMTVGSAHNAAPMAEAVRDFLKDRQMDVRRDPPIKEWSELVPLLEQEMTNLMLGSAPASSFREDLALCLNRWGKDNECGMPDHVIAQFMESSLDSLQVASFQNRKADMDSSPNRRMAIALHEVPDSKTREISKVPTQAGFSLRIRGPIERKLGGEVTPKGEPLSPKDPHGY